MALLYPKPVEYAIRAMTYLAGKQSEGSISVVEIAEHEDISSHHLSKVMKALARAKYVKALRGPGGGYRILVDPEEVTLWDVMGCLSAREGFSECAIGWAECKDEDPCPLHNRWKAAREKIEEYLRTCTIAELAVAAHMRDGGEEDRTGSNRVPIPLGKNS